MNGLVIWVAVFSMLKLVKNPIFGVYIERKRGIVVA